MLAPQDEEVCVRPQPESRPGGFRTRTLAFDIVGASFAIIRSDAQHHRVSRIIVGLLAHHRRVVGAADAPAGGGPPLAKVKRALTARA